MDTSRCLWVLSLNAKESGERTLYRLRRGQTLQIRLGPSLLGCDVNVFTNHPANEKADFDRSTYRKLEWTLGQDATAAFIDVRMCRSGSFRYYFQCETEDVGGEGYFLVDPILTYGPSDEKLPLDCIQCHTVLSKNLGPFKSWEDKLRVSKECGYNMIHFTPVNALGASNSAYSLRDQHALNDTFECGYDAVAQLVTKMQREWNVLSLCDIVLNHTANETPWINTDSDATYNCHNSPHLRPAYMLDRILFHLSKDIEDGVWADKGIPKAEVSAEHHLSIAKSLLYDHYFPQVKLFEFFLLDTTEVLQQFEKKILDSDPPSSLYSNATEELALIPDPQYRRLKCSVDLDVAMQLYNVAHNDCPSEDARILRCSSNLKHHLDRLNHEAYNSCWSHINSAVENVIKGARYNRVDPSGPRVKLCSRKEPLVCQYFLGPKADISLEEEERQMFSHEGKLFMAHNGWVMNHDPLINFALPGSMVYLRRELIAWGDSVKLRFGDKPEDSPFLWKYMKEYAEQTARVFHGIRLDNCHSTPINVAEYMLDAARKIRPDLYVIAELFTSSEATDNIFINRLGINSLIREALSAWDSHEQGRLVHRFGGEPVGAFMQLSHRPLVPSMAHAVFFDQTHDNESPVSKRSAIDLLPTAAMVSMACCASGSNRGYDELVPHHIHVVTEPRTYASWGEKGVTLDTGMVRGRKALNELHDYLGKNGYDELYVDQMDHDVVAITRHRPLTHESVIMVVHTAFSGNMDPNAVRHVKPVCVEGLLEEVVLEGRLVTRGEQKAFAKDATLINGLTNYATQIKQHIHISESKIGRMASSHGDKPQQKTVIELFNLLPGSIIAFKFRLFDEQSKASADTRALVKTLEEVDAGQDFFRIINDLTLLDLNSALFQCDQEERDSNSGNGVYSLNGYGPLKYAGLQGVMSILSEIRPKNDLGNWLPDNLRQGDWLMDYISGRLRARPGTSRLGEWFQSVAFARLKRIPRYLLPRYFDAVVTRVYLLLIERIWTLMSPFVRDGSSFVRALAMGSVQHTAVCKSAQLPALSPNLKSPLDLAPTLAAGLPHFSTGYMRSWGRDTFISLRGLLLLTGRFPEARAVILGYAGTLRHGLIPNLLDGGKNARFNCRDAVWWWLHCVLSYVDEAPDGAAILKDKVSRLFPTDDSEPLPAGACDQNLEDVMHEALQKHFQGLRFRERNAGTRIDEHMKDEGFNNQIGVDLETGFVFGGNVHNCGTWMDKMGSSWKAGNKGKPSSPRDGSAVEIVGLSFACLKRLSELNQQGVYSYNAVERFNDGALVKWKLSEWAERIRSNFETHYFVRRGNLADKRPDLINKEGIYKDTLNSELPWTDYQLRCNFPIAMAVAPDLFDVRNAWNALQIAKEKLLGPLGMATLDPDDWGYRGDYDNSNDSDDPSVSHGSNYHQGPEWVWPVGYFLRAYLLFAKKMGGHKDAKDFVMAVLSAHFVEVQQSQWRGIPELTNKSGRFCADSNPIQAWSMSCLLEVLYELDK